jgi:class 3 adenylate cyclase/predicted ATPase
MTFDDVLQQTLTLLQHQGRISYKALKRRFGLEDDYLEDLKTELLYSYASSIKEEGDGMVWTVEGLHETRRAPQPPTSWETTDGDRRQITVMFCDLVASTKLSTLLDPEEWSLVVQLYQSTSAAVIERYEGYVAQYLGDGLLVYFGYPRAHEEDAQRAVRAGLEIIAALHDLPSRHEQLRNLLGKHRQAFLQVRIGIHTGLVVVTTVGGGARREHLALGDTPNIAARLQGAAEPNTLFVSAATYRLIEGYFHCQSKGRYELKGLADPLQIYQVLSESDQQKSRVEIAATKGLTPLVGREGEVTFLRHCWAQAQEGQGQVVLLTGEAGIGKSRLVHSIKTHCENGAYAQLEARGSPYHQNSALYPAIDLLQRALQWKRADSATEKLAKLMSALSPYDVPAETVPLLATLLSLPTAEHSPALSFTPQKQRERTLHLIVTWLFKIAEHQPVLLILEDLHWTDPSTLELLGFLLARAATARMLVVLTARPEFHPPQTWHAHLTSLTLSRFNDGHSKEMIQYVTGGRDLPANVMQQIIAKTDGIPLFVEEMTKTVLESGLLKEEDGQYVHASSPSALLPALAIPATLSDSLMARLDRLTTAKEVAQLGAVLGKEFSYELLQAVAPLDERALRREVARLVEAELLYQVGELSQEKYTFKHALIWDAAYQSLLISKRQRYHHHIGQVLEEQFPETQEIHPELLAHHYTEANLIDKAIPYWHMAGRKAFRRSANVESIRHLTKGLALLAALPDSPERVSHEFRLQIALGGPLVMTKGYAAPEVASAYTRAHELCRQIGETPQLFPVLVGLWVFYVVRSELQKAHTLGSQLLHSATTAQDPALLLEAHNTLAHSSFYRGEFGAARDHAEACRALYDIEKHRSLSLLYVHDPGVYSLNIGAWSHWHLGYPEQALARNLQSIHLAEQLAHPFSIAQAFFNGAALHQLRREVQITQERAERVIAVCADQGFAFWGAAGMVLRGWAIAFQGREEEGVTQIRQGIAGYCATGARLGRPYLTSLLVEVYARVGMIKEGLATLEDALTLAAQSGEDHHLAELYRLKGELTLQQESKVQGPKSPVPNTTHLTSSTQGEAEACFFKALTIARAQHAKAWELRAAMSLLRLFLGQGRSAEARPILEKVYREFSEGFETIDLREAKDLLDRSYEETSSRRGG